MSLTVVPYLDAPGEPTVEVHDSSGEVLIADPGRTGPCRTGARSRRPHPQPWSQPCSRRRRRQELVGDRKRANEAARVVADLRDELNSARSDLEEMRDRYADMCTQRDVLTVELEDARAAVNRG